MGDSLENYRMQIGIFSPKFRKISSKRSKLEPTGIRNYKYLPNVRIVLAILLICSLSRISSLSSQTHRNQYQNINKEFKNIITDYKFSFQLDAIKKVYVTKSENDDPPEPGEIKAKKINFWARYVNGNRNKGIKICHWNIGGGYLYNKMDTLETILSDHSPHILGISEASFWRGHNLDDVRIPNYKVFFANTLDNPSLYISRVAVYVHKDLSVRVREDLMSQDFSSIWLEVGRKIPCFSNIHRLAIYQAEHQHFSEYFRTI